VPPSTDLQPAPDSADAAALADATGPADAAGSADAVDAVDSADAGGYSPNPAGQATEELLGRLRDVPTDDPRYERLRGQIVARHMAIARRIAYHYANRGEPVEDLEQAALVGLVKAINGFDPLLGRDFLAYARPMMTGEVKRHFRDLTWAVRVPRKVQEGRIELNQATGALSQRLGRRPAMQELAAELRISMDELAELTEASAAYSALSLNVPDGQDESRSLADTLGAVDEALDAVIDRESLHPLLDALPPRELRVLLLRFFGNLTQAQIAAELGVSQMQISRLLSATLAKLRASLLTET
jgi:RNA polymerase sigma-B factor